VPLLRTSRAAVWFAPAIILLAEFSPAAIVAALVLIVTASRLLYHEWTAHHHPPLPPPDPPTGLFARVELPSPNFTRDVLPGLAIAFAVQSGAAGVALRQPLLAGIAFAVSVALGTIFAMTTRAVRKQPPQSLPRTVLGVLLTIVLAIGLTVTGLLPRFHHARRRRRRLRLRRRCEPVAPYRHRPLSPGSWTVPSPSSIRARRAWLTMLPRRDSMA